MANTGNSDKWYFTKEQLENTPSRVCQFDAYKELQYRQQAANFIQDMGQKLKVSQLCINTAIVYMHRFYVFHSFTNFPWYQMAAAALFLAAKVEEQPRKLEYVIRVANICKNPRDSSFDINSERYIAQSQDLVFNENVLLQTLGFDVAIDHPHTYVVRCCHLVRASKDLAQTSYFMASNSLHLTTMCIQYKPTVVACFCILLACKWLNWEIPLSSERKEWFTYVDQTVTAELLEQLTSEFLVIFENCPSRLKEKIMAKQENFNSPLVDQKQDGSSQRSLEYKSDDPQRHRPSRPHEASSSGHRTQEQKEREYKERKEKERIAHMSGIALPHQSHHHRPDRPPMDQRMKPHSRQPPTSTFLPPTKTEPRDILREAAKEPSFGLPTIHDPGRDHAKEVTSRSDKEVPKRDPLLKPNVQTDLNSLNNYTDVRQRIDPNRPRVDPKTASKTEMTRRYEEMKPLHGKSETDSIKKHLTSSYDKTNAYLKSSSSSSSTSTSQKIKSPFNLDSKSVPKMNSAAPMGAPISKPPHYNGSTNGSYIKPFSHEHEPKIKTEVPAAKEEVPIHKEEIITPQFIKRPSLFSPEKTPPRLPEDVAPQALINLHTISPIKSPTRRNRNYSSSSEPELRPTMKKIDQVEGFETLMRDNTIGVGGIHNVPDASALKSEEQVANQHTSAAVAKSPVKDTTTVNPQSAIVNGLETNPTIISNLLKEAVHLPGVATASAKPVEPVDQSSLVVPPPEHKEKEHHHHKSKKKKEKHKHKDKEKSKAEKEKKKKHKDKDKEKHKHKERKDAEPPVPVNSEPIKIKIHNYKIQPVNEGLKIKIPKDKFITDCIKEPLSQPSSGGLKIKIPKEIITNCGTSSSNSLDLSVTSSTNSSRKRDRDRTSPNENPPVKYSKQHHHKESKQNGRPSYNKVSENNNSNESLVNSAVADNSTESNIVHEQKPQNITSLQCDNVSKTQNAASESTAQPEKASNKCLTLPGDTESEKISPVTPPKSGDMSEPKNISNIKGPANHPAPYKYSNNMYKIGNNAQFQQHNGYDDYLAPYHLKVNRGNFNQHVPPRFPRHPQPRHLIPGGPRHFRPPPPSQNHPPPPYPTAPPPMPFSTYPMPPPHPIMPNMNVPPPTYIYQSLPPYYPTYNVYPDLYQHPANIANNPPLPPEAPPSDIPPPPPPDEG